MTTIDRVTVHGVTVTRSQLEAMSYEELAEYEARTAGQASRKAEGSSLRQRYAELETMVSEVLTAKLKAASDAQVQAQDEELARLVPSEVRQADIARAEKDAFAGETTTVVEFIDPSLDSIDARDAAAQLHDDADGVEVVSLEYVGPANMTGRWVVTLEVEGVSDRLAGPMELGGKAPFVFSEGVERDGFIFETVETFVTETEAPSSGLDSVLVRFRKLAGSTTVRFPETDRLRAGRIDVEASDSRVTAYEEAAEALGQGVAKGLGLRVQARSSVLRVTGQTGRPRAYDVTVILYGTRKGSEREKVQKARIEDERTARRAALLVSGEGKTLGQMTPAERQAAIDEATEKLQAEFDQNGPAISEALAEASAELESRDLCKNCGQPVQRWGRTWTHSPIVHSPRRLCENGSGKTATPAVTPLERAAALRLAGKTPKEALEGAIRPVAGGSKEDDVAKALEELGMIPSEVPTGVAGPKTADFEAEERALVLYEVAPTDPSAYQPRERVWVRAYGRLREAVVVKPLKTNVRVLFRTPNGSTHVADAKVGARELHKSFSPFVFAGQPKGSSVDEKTLEEKKANVRAGMATAAKVVTENPPTRSEVLPAPPVGKMVAAGDVVPGYRVKVSGSELVVTDVEPAEAAGFLAIGTRDGQGRRRILVRRAGAGFIFAGVEEVVPERAKLTLGASHEDLELPTYPAQPVEALLQMEEELAIEALHAARALYRAYEGAASATVILQTAIAQVETVDEDDETETEGGPNGGSVEWLETGTDADPVRRQVERLFIAAEGIVVGDFIAQPGHVAEVISRADTTDGDVVIGTPSKTEVWAPFYELTVLRPLETSVH